jgi:RNA polymerase sigma factor (sigma-70 family)
MTHPGTPETSGAPLVGPEADRPRAERSAPAGKNLGAEHEFVGFYRGHVTRLIAYLVYQGATAHLAADIAQDAMTTAYRRWPEITSPRAYAWTVAYRMYMRHTLADAPEIPVGDIPEPARLLPRPEEAEAWLQTLQVNAVLRALPPRQRQVLALTIDGWTPAEIAELLNIDPAAVRSNLMKARRSAEGHRRSQEETP